MTQKKSSVSTADSSFTKELKITITATLQDDWINPIHQYFAHDTHNRKEINLGEKTPEELEALKTVNPNKEYRTNSPTTEGGNPVIIEVQKTEKTTEEKLSDIKQSYTNIIGNTTKDIFVRLQKQQIEAKINADTEKLVFDNLS